MIRGSPSTSWVSLENACMLSFARAFATSSRQLAPLACRAAARTRRAASSTSRCAYHTSRFAHRRELGASPRGSRRPSRGRPRRRSLRASSRYSRPATARLAASRLRSHSHGPGSVSSKSLTSKIEPALGRAEEAEVRRGGRHRRAARGCPSTACAARSAAMISGAAAVERERRDHHPPVADRDQLGHPRLAPAARAARPGPGDRRRLEFARESTAEPGSRCLATRDPFIDRQMLDGAAGRVLAPRCCLRACHRGTPRRCGGPIQM